MFDDPDFAFHYVRPVAMVTGVMLGYWLINAWLDARQRNRDEQAERMRDVTPR